MLKKYQKPLQMKSMKDALDNMISSVRNIRKKDERDHECEDDTEDSSSDEEEGGIKDMNKDFSAGKHHRSASDIPVQAQKEYPADPWDIFNVNDLGYSEHDDGSTFLILRKEDKVPRAHRRGLSEPYQSVKKGLSKVTFKSFRSSGLQSDIDEHVDFTKEIDQNDSDGEWVPSDDFDALAYMAAENPNKKRDSLDKVKDSLKTVKSGMKKGFKKAAVKMHKRSQSEGAFPTQRDRSKSEGAFPTAMRDTVESIRV
jgi:hypothetical protein